MPFIHRIVSLLKILFFQGIWKRNSYNQSHIKRILLSIPWWLMQVLFALLDILSIGTIIRYILHWTNSGKLLDENFIKQHISLNEKDIRYLKTVVIIEESWLATLGMAFNDRKQLGLGVASTIHFSRKIDITNEQDLRWIIHELAHTLQWKYRGLIYIPEALICQRFSGYSFGGIKTLEQNYSLKNFNPEQQAEIFVAIQNGIVELTIKEEIWNGKW